MMSLCKTFHTLLGFADPDDRCRGFPRRPRCSPTPSDAAGLRCLAGHFPSTPAHVVESAAVGPRPPLFPSSPPPSPLQEQPVERIDGGTRGLSYIYGGGGGGGGRLELCTESLGFESCCDGMMGAEEERAEQDIGKRIEEANGNPPGDQRRGGVPRRKARRGTEAKEFPPPLTWLGGGGESGGRCSNFLKAVRKDGRFLLTEIRIERPEVLRASRRDGRLRLELVKPRPEVVEEEEASEMEEIPAGKALGAEQEEDTAVEEEEEIETAAAAAEDEEVEPRWQLPAAAWERRREGSGGYRSGRCQEVAREVLSSSPFWGSPFVTTA